MKGKVFALHVRYPPPSGQTHVTALFPPVPATHTITHGVTDQFGLVRGTHNQCTANLGYKVAILVA